MKEFWTMPPLDVTQPPESLGECYSLGELERAIGRAINRYGSDTKIFGDNEKGGIALGIRFPKGERPYLTFSTIDASYSDAPPENLV
jgi:hypothetical protein